MDPVDLNMDLSDNDISTQDEELFNLDAFDFGNLDLSTANLEDIGNPCSSPFRSLYVTSAILNNDYGPAASLMGPGSSASSSSSSSGVSSSSDGQLINDESMSFRLSYPPPHQSPTLSNDNAHPIHHHHQDASQLCSFTPSPPHPQFKHPHHPHPQQLARITDYSPEWSFAEGGIKVLVAGPWHSPCAYTVLFDGVAVPTSMIQPGLLRCYCPAHESGFVSLQVSCNGMVVSDSVIFEYRDHPLNNPPSHKPNGSGATSLGGISHLIKRNKY